MKGLLLFIAGLLCGGAAIAWLLVGRESHDPVAVETTSIGTTIVDDAAYGPDPLADAPAAPIPPHPAAEQYATPGTPAAPAAAVPDRKVAPDTPVASDPGAAAAPAAAPPPPDPKVLASLQRMSLLLPVQGIEPDQLDDTYSDARGEGRSHDAIDIMAPLGRPVRAVADGRIAKLFASVPGGLTIYQFDGDEQVAFYYAHLDRYAEGLAEGQVVRRGDVIGYVGFSGNANASAPHLHFAVFVLGPEKRWWKGTAVNPYPLLRKGDSEVDAARAAEVAARADGDTPREVAGTR